MKCIFAVCAIICLSQANALPKPETRALERLLNSLRRNGDEQNMSLMSEMVERKKVMKRSAGCSCDTDSGSTGSGTDSSSGLSASDKQAILDKHNRLRAEVGVGDLTWNDELATIAQNYADKCVFQHNSNRNNEQGSWWWIGENIATGYPWSSASNAISKGLYGWGDKEKPFFTYGTGCVDGVCGHYTQMIWKTTTEVGCGVTLCDEISNIGWSNAYMMVCNYGPTGNVGGYSNPY